MIYEVRVCECSLWWMLCSNRIGCDSDSEIITFWNRSEKTDNKKLKVVYQSSIAGN